VGKARPGQGQARTERHSHNRWGSIIAGAIEVIRTQAISSFLLFSGAGADGSNAETLAAELQQGNTTLYGMLPAKMGGAGVVADRVLGETKLAPPVEGIGVARRVLEEWAALHCEPVLGASLRTSHAMFATAVPSRPNSLRAGSWSSSVLAVSAAGMRIGGQRSTRAWPIRYGLGFPAGGR